MRPLRPLPQFPGPGRNSLENYTFVVNQDAMVNPLVVWINDSLQQILWENDSFGVVNWVRR